MDWLNEAVSNYVVFLFSIVFGAIGFFITRWLTRKRPKRVKLEKVAESSLIEIDPEVRDEIVVTYKGERANSLYLTVFTMWNTSADVIDGVKVTVEFRDTRVIEVVLDDPFPERASSVVRDDPHNRLELVLPYLNPRKSYRDRVKVKVFALTPIEVKDISGGGRGWAVDFFDRVQFLREATDAFGSAVLASSPLRMVVSGVRMFFIIVREVTVFTIGGDRE